MRELLDYLRSRQQDLVDLTSEMVKCESPSGDAAALARMAEFVADRVAGMAKTHRLRGGHLLCEFQLPGKGQKGRILGLGHIDTVWPVGTLQRMPLRIEDGRLWGPGVLDMKAGIAIFICAMQALRELELPVRRKVALLLNADEETGSATSREITEREALRSSAVLVMEPGTGLDGKLKTARKGVGGYRLTVRGKAAHAGVDFAAGASAILELARQIDRVAGFTDISRGTTVNPGVISGGTRSNVVAEEARAEIDIRVARLADATKIDRRFRTLRPFDKRCTVSVEGGLNRPPMERSGNIVQLFRTARKVGAEIGLNLEESMTGGGSDGNFTAALGVPTLDGLGAVGEGAHASHESILVDRLPDRAALVAGIVQEL